MAGPVHSCPVPGCSWSWREIRRPVGQGAEFERRLAQRARMRAAILVEHVREHHGDGGALDERRPGRETQPGR